MSVQLTSDVSQIRAERCSNGGWVVFRVEGPIYRITESSPMAACSDDEALLQWLAFQFGLPAPEIATVEPAPRSGFAYVLVRELAALNRAFSPLEAIVERLSHRDEGAVIETDAVDLDGQRIVLSLAGLRALVRAAGPVLEKLPF